TYSITQADIDGGSVTNLATAHSNGTDSNESTQTVTADQRPALARVKIATPTTYDHVGQVISYSYLVTNTGNVTLAGPVSLSDDNAPVTCPAGPLPSLHDALPISTYSITQADIDGGSVTNHATAHSNGTDSNEATQTVTAVKQPALSLVKTATPTTYDHVGQVITYSYLVTNTGNVTLPGPFSVSDDKLGTISPCGSGPLAPGASTSCTATHTITQADLDAGHITNVACASGNGTTTNPCGTATVRGNQNPALALSK